MVSVLAALALNGIRDKAPIVKAAAIVFIFFIFFPSFLFFMINLSHTINSDGNIRITTNIDMIAPRDRSSHILPIMSILV